MNCQHYRIILKLLSPGYWYWTLHKVSKDEKTEPLSSDFLEKHPALQFGHSQVSYGLEPEEYSPSQSPVQPSSKNFDELRAQWSNSLKSAAFRLREKHAVNPCYMTAGLGGVERGVFNRDPVLGLDNVSSLLFRQLLWSQRTERQTPSPSSEDSKSNHGHERHS